MVAMSGVRTLVRICEPSRPSGSPLDHRLLDLGDGLAGIQPLGARPRAVENGVAPIEPERILETIQPLPRCLIAAVGQPALGLKQNGRAEEAIRVPPMARTA